jgi:hypothetical protein
VAIASGVLGSYENDAIRVTLAYNDANGAVQSVTAANNSAKPLWFRVWLRADPAQAAEGTVPGGTTQTFSNLGGNIRYSPVEVAPGSPKETNFDYTCRVG